MSMIKNSRALDVMIGGEKIEAEYYEFIHDYNFCDISDNKNWLSQKWDKIILPFYRFKNKVRNVYWEIRYGFQRMFKGYDSVDTFEMFDKFIERYRKILIVFKKNLHSHPCELTEEEWNEIIDEMIHHLYFMDEDNVIEELSKNVSENWKPSYKTIYEIMNKHKNEFFKLFSEYFYDLWD